MKVHLFGPLFTVAAVACIAADQPLPALRDGSVLSGPGQFRHDGELRVQGHVALRNLALDLRGPIKVAEGAVFELDNVHLTVSDPPGAPNGASGLRCEGPAHVIVRASTMKPAGSAHPMWDLKGDLQVDDFQTENSEFHLDHVEARLHNLRIFELQVSGQSHVVGDRLRLVFLSSHTGDNDRVSVAGIPADQPFSRKLTLGSGSTADLLDTSAQLFLLYVHGRSEVALSQIGRAQLAIFPQCKGTFRLPNGRVGTASEPVVVPSPGTGDCPFRFTLADVNVDTWDVYAGGNADVTFTGSRIDELTANGNAKLTVRESDLFADWLSLAADSQLLVEDSTVGALRLASQRPDLATSQIRLSGRARANFSRVRFDCGIVASGDAHVEIHDAVSPPKYMRTSDNAVMSPMTKSTSNDKH